jgi:hypothetical protein
MIEPRLQDVVISKDGRSGRIELITEYEGAMVVGVKYQNQRHRDFCTVAQLRWNSDHWEVV